MDNEEIVSPLLKFDLQFAISLILLSLTFKESGIKVPYHLYTLFYTVASFQLIFLLIVFVTERQRNLSGSFTSLAYSINSYLITFTIVIFAFFVSEALLSIFNLSQSDKLLISIVISVMVFIPLIKLSLKERKLNKLILQVPSRITLYRTKSNEDESPFDIVIYNNTKKNIENLELLVESSKDIKVFINKNREKIVNLSGTFQVGLEFDLKPNGRRFYIPQVEISESAQNTDTLKVTLLMNKKNIIERQILVEIR